MMNRDLCEEYAAVDYHLFRGPCSRYVWLVWEILFYYVQYISQFICL